MIFDYEFKTGLVFGLEQDQLVIFDEETQQVDGGPCNVIYLHLGPVSLICIFD